MKKNEMIVNGMLLNLKKIEDRSKLMQIIKDTMKNCEEDYFKI